MPAAAFDGVADDDRPQINALVTLQTAVSRDWIDYNGHMTEWQYYKVFADAGENFLRAMGFTEEYRLKGFSFFSVEGHQRNLRECRVGTSLRVFTEMLGFDRHRLHIYQYAIDVERDIVLATGEHMMIHVDTNQRKSTPIDSYMEGCLSEALYRWHPEQRPRGLSTSIKTVPA